MIKKTLIFLAVAATLSAQKSRPQRVVNFTAGGTANAITGTPSPALAAYSDLSTTPLTQVCFTASATSTGSVTVNLNSLGAKALKKVSAGAISDAGANDLVSGQVVCAVYLSSPDYLMLTTPAGNLGSGSSGGETLDPGTATIKDELCIGNSSSGNIGSLGWYISGTLTLDSPNNQTSASIPCSVGITSTGSESILYLGTGDRGMPLPNIGAQTFDSRFIFNMARVASANMRAGFFRQGFGATNTSLYISYDAATSTNWFLNACSNGTCATPFDTGVAAAIDTNIQFRVRATTAGTYLLSFKVSGGSFSAERSACASACDMTIAAITSGFSMIPVFGVDANDTTATTLRIDYFAAQATGVAR